jgi:hypothetical protein
LLKLELVALGFQLLFMLLLGRLSLLSDDL